MVRHIDLLPPELDLGQEYHHEEDVSDSMIQEAIAVARNDISRLPTIRIMESEIDQIHFEDTYQKHRLNKEVDINDIDIRRLMRLLEASENHFTPLTTATLRTMSASTQNLRVQLDSGANRSVTPNREFLYGVTPIPSMELEGVGGL